MPERSYKPLLWLLLVTCIACFWIPLLSESFWGDETVTAFVLRHGATHPSMAASARLDQTIYYWLPQISQTMFGFSEFSLRLPSLVVMLVSLWVMGRIAARFIHPDAAWFVVFLGFIPHEFTRQATDARPYGLGTCVAVIAIWLLIRWMDQGGWRDGVLFVLFASLLLRVHLIYWPFYVVFGCYSLLRWLRRETPVSGRWLVAAWAVTFASLVPLVPVTLELFRTAKVFVAIPLPGVSNILSGFQIPLVGGICAGFWILARVFRWQRGGVSVSLPGVVLLLIWWLWQPFSLLAGSWITGDSVFQPRYFALALPGTMLVCTLIAALFIPVRAWKPVALVLAIGVLSFHFAKEFPPSRNSHWREAAARVNSLTRDSDMPVVCLSPFVEAKPPAWVPDYPLPGFIYSHLDAYPIHAATVLLPNHLEPQGEQYAEAALRDRVLSKGRFLVYGGVYDVNLWTQWIAAQSELAGWTHHPVGFFGDVEVVTFQR